VPSEIEKLRSIFELFAKKDFKIQKRISQRLRVVTDEINDMYRVGRKSH